LAIMVASLLQMICPERGHAANGEEEKEKDED
jgi:hypothetical protein